jgi:hypothetical protein
VSHTLGDFFQGTLSRFRFRPGRWKGLLFLSKGGLCDRMTRGSTSEDFDGDGGNE